MKKTYLAVAIASLMSMGGGNATTVTVESGPYQPISVSSQSTTIYQGSGTESMELKFPSTHQDAVVQVNNGSSLQFKNLDKFLLTDDSRTDISNFWSSAIFVRPDGDAASSMSFDNVHNVSIGTSANSADYYWSLYMTRGALSFDGGDKGAESGTFEINNNGYQVPSNSSVAGYGIYSAVQTWASNNTTPDKWQSEVVIKNYNQVSINTYSIGIASSLISDGGSGTNQNGSRVVIDAGTVTVKSSNAQAVAAYDSEHSGNVGIEVNAQSDIVLTSNSNTVLISKKGSGAGSINLNSAEGRVDISTSHSTGAAVAVVAQNTGAAAATITSNIVKIAAPSASGTSISVQGGVLDLKAETAGVTTLVGNVNASSGTLGLINQTADLSEGSTFSAGTLKGSNSALVLNGLHDATTVTVANNQLKDFTVVASSNLNDSFSSAEEAAVALKDAVSITNAENGSYSLSGQSGAISDAWTADKDGKITSQTENESMSSLENFNAMTLVQWRNEANHINQRLGDVRDASSTIGAWARVYGYDSSYSDNVSIDYKANSIQVGGDYRINDTWLVGGAFSYTDGEGKFSNGSSESDGYTLAAYLSGFFPCGGYVDLVGRIGRLSTDITAGSQGSIFKGDYANTTFGLSAEVGYHWKFKDIFYVEPQAELAYGFVKGDDFTGDNRVKISQDDFQTLVGRLGARVGASFADGDGTVYAHASVNHDFLGDADYSASYNGDTRNFGVDIGGTWVSYGVGAQFNTSANLNFYGTLERSNGSEYQEDYRYSVGMSYRF